MIWQFLLKTHVLRGKHPPLADGFTMVEVLVAILVATAFVMGTLQAMVINAIYQVRAEREAQATFWIQQDMEKIKGIAELPPLDGSDTSPCWAAGEGAFDDGFGGMLRDELHANYAIGDSYSSNAKTLNVQIASEKRLVNSKRPYRLVRIVEGLTPVASGSSMRVADQSPHVLRVTYKVGEPYVAAEDSNGVDAGGDKLRDDDGKGFKEILAQFYTEVIPGGSFKCNNP